MHFALWSLLWCAVFDYLYNTSRRFSKHICVSFPIFYTAAHHLHPDLPSWRFTNGGLPLRRSLALSRLLVPSACKSPPGIATERLKIWSQKSVKIKTLLMFMEEILPRLTWRIFLICFYSLLGVHIISQLASRISSINYRPKFWQPPDSFSATSVLKKAVLLGLFNTTHQANPETKKEVFEFFVNFCGRRWVSFFYLWVIFHLHDATHLPSAHSEFTRTSVLSKRSQDSQSTSDQLPGFWNSLHLLHRSGV